jgi:hypothetical protein
MTIIEVTKNKAMPDVGRLMRKLVGNRCSLGLLRFFVIHPNGRFSKLAIVHAIDDNGSRLEVEKALMQLVNDGVLKTSAENNICYYLLTRDEPMRRVVLNMADFDWRQWQIVLEDA